MLHTLGTDLIWSEDGVREFQVLINSDLYGPRSLHREPGVRFKLSRRYRDYCSDEYSAMSDSDSMECDTKSIETKTLHNRQESITNDF